MIITLFGKGSPAWCNTVFVRPKQSGERVIGIRVSTRSASITSWRRIWGTQYVEDIAWRIAYSVIENKSNQCYANNPGNAFIRPNDYYRFD